MEDKTWSDQQEMQADLCIYLFILIWVYKTQKEEKKNNIIKYCEIYNFLKLYIVYHCSSIYFDNQNTPTRNKPVLLLLTNDYY